MLAAVISKVATKYVWRQSARGLVCTAHQSYDKPDNMNIFIERLALPFYKYAQDQNLITDINESNLTQYQRDLLCKITSIKNNCHNGQISEAYNEWKHLLCQHKHEILTTNVGVVVSNILIHFMGRKDLFEDTMNRAMNVFDEMIEQKIKPNIHTYKAIAKTITHSQSIDKTNKANKLYKIMMNDSNINMYDDITMVTSIMAMFGSVSDTKNMNDIWDHFMENQPEITDLVACNLVMRIYFASSEFERVLKVYDCMLK
eukprot:377023_1